jgi:hypothetical protein
VSGFTIVVVGHPGPLRRLVRQTEL